MRGKLCLLVGVCAAALSQPVLAQNAAPAKTPDANGVQEIIVTAQRQSQRLQDVPIAVSAFNANALEKQQIKTTSDLQLSLPNVTFTKTNFTSSSFTIRGVGNLCVGESCEPSTAIHLNDAPLSPSTRLFEGEFYDLAQIEVLRGPHRAAGAGQDRAFGRCRIRQLQFDQGQGHGQRADRPGRGRARGGVLPEARWLYDQPL
jgi:outer membrane receptor protein involved in Fe transport